ncbi:MAG: hypothetical protein H6983_02035 [Ectothiorhodospiraceae bacterium]|nr:hypothetical protein [Ectothiorhodospiraceae bacterium]
MKDQDNQTTQHGEIELDETQLEAVTGGASGVPGLSLTTKSDPSAIGLLLPAVQKVREAAR